MSVKNTYFIFLVCLYPVLSTRAQTVDNVISVYDGEKMVITYDLNATDAGQKFKVSLFSSHDNYTQPLTLLTGDAGDNVLPGKNHRVTWDVKNSVRPGFEGEIRIKVKAVRLVPVMEPVKTEAASKLVIKPLIQNSYKKGSTIHVSWAGGQAGDKLLIELLKGGEVQQKIAEKANSPQTWSWLVPKDMKAGKDYVVRVTNSSRGEDRAVSQVFTIKPKIPMLLKVAPVMVIGAAVYVITSGSKTSKNDLPGPVKPN